MRSLALLDAALRSSVLTPADPYSGRIFARTARTSRRLGFRRALRALGSGRRDVISHSSRTA